MARPPKPFRLPEQDRKALERLCRYEAPTWDLALRAMIVLKCGLGEDVRNICDELGVGPRTVYNWRRRYQEFGLDGLQDALRAEGRTNRRTAAPAPASAAE